VFTASLVAGLLLAAPLSPKAEDKPLAKAAMQIGHMVYFKLKDASPAAQLKLVEACDTYLEARDGVVFYAAGVRGEEFKRAVNDLDFDVSLHIVFKDKASHDAYEVHPEHLKFIEAGKANWTKVRVFDSEMPLRKKK
jgi:hypothetical protein